ncbi:zinc finger protein 189-like isoform X2 [Ambystoma mexicanum]|uniref:zinc finger protein 189-like isoform X2 n=1 Tax=Ambystoma mexicanum TaxID=8296 RepID=UPI0037E741AA
MEPPGVPFKLHDVRGCFSEEEWRLLHEWQKELYKNVMKEIHQALISLGPLIATTVFSLRAKEKDDQCVVNTHDSETISDVNHSTDTVTPSCAVSIRIKAEKNQYLDNSQNTDRRDCQDYLSTDYHHGFYPDIVFPNQEEKEIHCREWSVSEGSEIRNRGTKVLPLSATDVCSMKMEEPKLFLTDHPGEDREHSSPPISEHEVISLIIKEEEVACSLDPLDVKNIRIHSSLTGPNKSLKSTGLHRTKNWESACVFNKAARNISRKSNLINNHKIHPGGKAFTSTENSSSVNYESNLPKPHLSHRGQGLSTWTKHRGSLIDSLKWNQNRNVPTGLKVCVCSRCGICFNHLTNSNTHEQVNNEEQQNICSGCTKSLSRSSNLNKEHGKHMVHKTHICTECGKSFKTSQLLVRHWRIHTGEKPYMCITCGKSFRQTAHLIRHQRMHVREKTIS